MFAIIVYGDQNIESMSFMWVSQINTHAHIPNGC